MGVSIAPIQKKNASFTPWPHKRLSADCNSGFDLILGRPHTIYGTTLNVCVVLKCISCYLVPDAMYYKMFLNIHNPLKARMLHTIQLHIKQQSRHA